MAPETNIGSSTPIDSSGSNISSDLRRKVINDAAASLRGAREVTRPQRQVGRQRRPRRREPDTARRLSHQNVIDLVAPTLPALLDEIDGRTTVPRALHVCTPRGAEIVNVSPGFLTSFLSTLIDPNIVSLLFLAGIVGLGVRAVPSRRS